MCPDPHFLSFQDVVETIIETGKDLNIFATMVWAVWYRRNTMRTSVATVEVIAAKKALQFAKDLGLSSIILEGDSKIAIDGLKSKKYSLIRVRSSVG
ncbi:hypothetical protein SO802_026212 [Lithocarpus litseifolius]|uniref:RNase H type-1 domain-containing protein n=1 Tax=Lithocarpus litseifolius TaxID=425828 RepID=A0AAW2BZF7_9ROSI